MVNKYRGPLQEKGSITLAMYPAPGIRFKNVVITVVAASLVSAFIAFYAGAYYNAWRQVDSVLPSDTSVVRDLGYVAPAQYRLEVGML